MAVRVKSKSPATNGRPRTAVNGEEDDAAWRRKTGRKHGKLMGIRHILQNYIGQNSLIGKGWLL